MSLLDDENILTTDLKKKINNPFFLLKQIFILAHKDNNGMLFQYKDDILNALKSIEIPKHTKWYINYDVIELVDNGYYGEPGDYYKIFACISFYHRTKRLMFDVKISHKFTHGKENIYCDIIGELTKRKYDLVQITNHIFVYKS
jgi:hypothetical protein